MNGDEAFRRIQGLARSNAARTGRGAPTQEYLIRHSLESLLARLGHSQYAESFVLKGGLLLATYDVRRATRDADFNAISVDVTPDQMLRVIEALIAVGAADGVVFDVNRIEIIQIRDEADYPGMRIHVATTIGPWNGTTIVDVSTGDPIVPEPQKISLNRLWGDPIELYGYAPETIIAEKGVTILERGITSTRWRDYVDIVQLANRGFDPDVLWNSAQTVASYRNVQLRPIAAVVEGYGAIGQLRWAAWRRKGQFEAISEAHLDDQMALVAAILDPVFGRNGDESITDLAEL